MRKTKSIIAILLMLCMVMYFIPYKAFATTDYEIQFDNASIEGNVVTFDVGEIKVSATVSGATISNNKLEVNRADLNNVKFALSNFNRETMAVVIRSPGNPPDTLTVNDNNEVSFVGKDLPDGGIHFGIETVNNGGTGENSIEIQFDNASIEGNVVTFDVGEIKVSATVSGATISNNKLEVNRADLNNVKFALSNFNKETMAVVIRSPGGYQDTLIVNGDNEVSFAGKNLPDGGIHFSIETVNNGGTGENPGENPGDETSFDGRAYFAWEYNGNLCYHKFEGLTGRTVEGYEINYISTSDLIDQSGNNGTYTFGQKLAGWVLATDMEDESGIVKYSAVVDVLGDGRDNHGIELNPCGAVSGENSICTNGDQNFRATIYNDKYEAISFGASEDDYQYFPGFWDKTFFSSTVDISGTTKANPAIYQAYLLERTIKLNLGDHSKSNIKSIKALDVNSDAVTIRNTSGNNYEITFNSNYYDKVTFEVTDVENNTYYIKIGRTVMRVEDNFGPETTNPKVTSQLYYPTNYNYNDFEVFAKVYYDDGTSITKKATPTIIGLLNGHVYDSYETEDAGKNLKLAAYSVDTDENVTNVYFTVVYKGALNGDTYGGTFAGSGKGANYDVEEREIIYK